MQIEIGVMVLTLLAVVQGVMLFVVWRQLRLQRMQLHQWLLASTGDVPTSMLVIAQARMERKLESLQLQLELPRARPAPVAVSDSFGLAQQLARQGAGVEELIARCGLSRGEAELVQRMQEIAA
ncbi:DUF2802 domain-containing protein [Dyella silvatica]|uniref:DUF2802 domain-containing protein n=1 Tax=Dyella silvatica TaxID=2992128 RepID=UPI0022522FC0|nr:DUF2802 domain-containing protein [Dyella silvatica]